MLLVTLLIVSVELTVLVRATGYAGELAPQELASSAAYLDTTVSLFLGPELYGELYRKQQRGALNIEDEIMENIADVFEQADLDHNGELTREEMAAVLGKSKHILASENLIQDFHHLDTNGDNRLSWREYFKQTFSEGFVEKADRGLVDIEAMQGGRIEYESFYAYYKFQRFLAADSDKSDSLSHSEYLMFMKPNQYPQMRDIYFEEVMADIQTDDDYKYVSLEEYKASVEASILLSRPDDLEQHMEKQLQKFIVLDVDKDGQLDKNETIEWIFGSVRTDYGHLAKADVRKYFRICDKDKNDRIDFNEIIAQSEFIYGAIDPDESLEVGRQLKEFFDDHNATDIIDFFTPEALKELAEKEKRKRENPYSSLIEELEGVEGFDTNFFDKEHKTSTYEYDPAWDPDNIKYKWGFIKSTHTQVQGGYTLSEYVEQVRERNGYYQL